MLKASTDPFALREFLHVLSLEYRGTKAARILDALSEPCGVPGVGVTDEDTDTRERMTTTTTAGEQDHLLNEEGG